MVKKEEKTIICNICKKRPGVVHYANSIMDWTHGFSEYICRQCYIEKLEKNLKNINKGLEEQKRLLKKDEQKRTATVKKRNQ